MDGASKQGAAAFILGSQNFFRELRQDGEGVAGLCPGAGYCFLV